MRGERLLVGSARSGAEVETQRGSRDKTGRFNEPRTGG